MAQNLTINGVTYNSVNSLSIPKSAGGNAVFPDTSDANATTGDIALDKTAYANGVKITGTGTGGGGALTTATGSITPASVTTSVTITHNLGVIPKNVWMTRNSSIGGTTPNGHFSPSIHVAVSTKNEPFVASIGASNLSIWARQNYSGSSCSFGISSQNNTGGVIGPVVTSADATTATIVSPAGQFQAAYYGWRVEG